MKDNIFGVWLTVSLNFNSTAVAAVLRKFTAEEAFSATESELLSAGLSESTAKKLCGKDLERTRAIIEKCAEKNIKIINWDSPEYPRALDRISNKPYVIYVRGNTDCMRGKKTAALVGTRKMTSRGKEHSEGIARRLISEGYLLVSGLADGVDTVAARVSLEMGVPTVAVLGVDIDRYFPKVNQVLTDRVAKTGAVISEYPPDTGARYFPARNRIIVGLSDIVNVTEAPANSGALIGARLAMKNKIPTYALGLDGDSFEGSRQLIAEGARPLEGSAQGEKAVKRVKKAIKSEEKQKEAVVAVPDKLTGTCRYIFEKLMTGPKTDNSLVDENHPIRNILIALTELELGGYIKSLPGGKFALK